MAVALDQQFQIQKKGIREERIGILNPAALEEHFFVTYLPSPTDEQDGSAIDQWIERMNFLCQDLTWLLQQDHKQFWCQAAFNRDFHSMFDSYLRYAPRIQRTISSHNYSFIPNGKALEENLCRLMFLCVLRLSTHKESAEHFFTPEGFARTIYDHFIFDVPRLLDICSLFAATNKDLLSKIIGNIFQQQPKYLDDLRVAIRSISEVINSKIQSLNNRNAPKKISSLSRLTTSLGGSANDLVDLLYYILDLSSTINRFFLVYPAGKGIVFEENFHLTLVSLFETFLRVYQRAKEAKEISPDVEVFEETKFETISLLHDLLASCCIDPLLTNENPAEFVESMLAFCSLIVTEKRCLAAYEDYFDLAELLDLVHQATNLLDDQQMKFYKDGIKQSIERYGTPSCKRKLTATATATISTEAKPKSTNPAVQTIKDLFPHLDDRYIEVCLKHYDQNSERLVNALFDNTVPEHLQIEEKQPERPEFRDEPPRHLVENVEQFDVFNEENIADGRVFRGKKTRDDPSDLNDKSFMRQMSDRFSRLGLVEDVSEGEYDDEYDDTYDDGIVNVQDKDDQVDKDLFKNENRLVGKQPGRFRQGPDDDEEDEDSAQAKRRDQFVENPEVVRERMAQQRAARFQRQHPQPAADRNVVGAARGRGQTGTVTHNRRWKDAHKSTQGNHNRRDRAAQKSNRGLLS